MLVSIVIPAKNEEKYIAKTLKSVIRLDKDNFDTEVIVVNGGSIDKTREIAKHYKVHIVSSRHGGIGSARQAGLKAAKGDIIAYTDADTLVPSNWLIELISVLKEPNVVAVYGGVRVYDGWWVYRLYINKVQPIGVFLFSIFGNHLGHGGNMAFWRKKLMSIGGFDEKLMLFEDIEVMKRLKVVGRIRYLHKLVVQSSGRRGDERWQFFFRNIKDAWDYYVRRLPIPTYPEFR